MSIQDNLTVVRKRIREKAEQCGRDPETIHLVAVSKHQPLSSLQQAFACGQTHFGENYLQEAATKISLLPGATFHCIGPLQSNKAKTAVELFDLIHTVDRLKIAVALNRHAAVLNKIQDILIQVNVSGEGQKSGVAPERLEELLRIVVTMDNLRAAGLMTMPPWSEQAEQSRPWFRKLRQLALEMQEKQLFSQDLPVFLSMGMSGDFEVAIEEGATLVRVGTAIFGERT